MNFVLVALAALVLGAIAGAAASFSHYALLNGYLAHAKAEIAKIEDRAAAIKKTL